MERLRSKVIEQITEDIASGDLTALDELLSFVPKENLIGYLSEEDGNKYTSQIDEAMGLVTIEMLKSLTYGEEIQLTENYCLYHYSEDDLIVFNDSVEWEELYVVQYDSKTGKIIFEAC